MLLERKLNESHDYSDKHTRSIHVTGGVTVTSLSAGLLQKISAATECLCQIALSGKLSCKCEKCKFSCHVKAKLRKTKSCKRRTTCNWLHVLACICYNDTVGSLFYLAYAICLFLSATLPHGT
jgi:hypothetical protein